MPLTPEDNTGLANADSYVTQAAFVTYCTDRGRDVSDFSADEQDQALRRAFTYVNAQWPYKSVPKVNEQAGEFPRVDLSDGMGRVFNVVPQRVKDAQCEAAYIDLTEGPLFENVDRGGQIVSETVGPISTTYAAGAPAAKLLQVVERLLSPFVRTAEPRRPLANFNDYSAEGTEDPIFSVGMDDNPGNG